MAKPILFKNTFGLTDDQDTITGNFLDYASDADGDPLTVANVDGQYVAGFIGGGKGSNTIAGTYGTLTVYQDGSFVYDLNDGLNLASGDVLVEDFSVKIRDSSGLYASNIFKFEITGTSNDAPVAVDDFYGTAGGTVSGNILDNDFDPDGDVLYAARIFSGSNTAALAGAGDVTFEGVYGTIVINETGAFTYTVNYMDADTVAAGGTGTEVFFYKPGDAQFGEGNNYDYGKIEISF